MVILYELFPYIYDNCLRARQMKSTWKSNYQFTTTNKKKLNTQQFAHKAMRQIMSCRAILITDYDVLKGADTRLQFKWFGDGKIGIWVEFHVLFKLLQTPQKR